MYGTILMSDKLLRIARIDQNRKEFSVEFSDRFFMTESNFFFVYDLYYFRDHELTIPLLLVPDAEIVDPDKWIKEIDQWYEKHTREESKKKLKFFREIGIMGSNGTGKND